MIRRFNILLLGLLTLTAVSCITPHVKNNEPSLLLIPNRFTIVQLAFEISQMRPMDIVAYNGDASSMVLHLWDARAQDWTRISIEDYADGRFITRRPKRVVMVGARNDISSDVDSSAWCSRVTHVKSLDIKVIVNTLNEGMRFSRGEWQLLADNHGLKFKDNNKDRRRYGRYGRRPGQVGTSVRPAEKTYEPIAPVRGAMPVDDHLVIENDLNEIERLLSIESTAPRPEDK